MNHDKALLREHQSVVRLEPFEIAFYRVRKRAHPEDWGGEMLEPVALTTNDVNGMVLI
jgi:hypothetical protein